MSHLADFQYCNFCPKKCFTKTGLKIHIDKAHGKQLSNHENENQVDKTALNSTVNLEQTIKKQPTSEKYAERTVAKEVLQNTDQDENYFQGKNKKFKCSICQKELKQKLGLQRHVTIVHEKQRSFECQTCEKEFAYKHLLKRHVITVHEKQRLFKCQICNFEFGQNSALKQHIIAVHEKLKPFKCQICEFEFSAKDSLKTHLSVVHEKQKLFKCQICEFEFGHRGSLKQHIKVVHEKLIII